MIRRTRVEVPLEELEQWRSLRWTLVFVSSDDDGTHPVTRGPWALVERVVERVEESEP